MVKKTVQKKVNIFKGESNPFNMKINRDKRCILGQKVKGTKGLRGLSRAESHAKRKDLWHKTRVIAEKANKFTDKRWMDGSEESSINRLVQERKKKMKKNIFNLNEETLTHKGMPLDEAKIDRDGKESGSEDDDQLDATYVNKAHFGGFDSGSKSSEPKSHKEILDELIVESKKKKYEKKLEKEQSEDLTEDLDKGWKEFLSVVGSIKSVNTKPVSEKSDPYTILTNQLKYEKRGTPSSRTKTAEELEREEKERLKKLEEERLIRMKDDGEQKSQNVSEHVSADSIFDDFDLQPVPVEEKADGKPETQNESDYSDSQDSNSESGDSQGSEDEMYDEMEMEVDAEVPEKDISRDFDKNLPIIPSNIAGFEEYVDTSKFTPERIGKAVEDILKPYLKAKSEKTLKRLSVFFGVLIEYALKNLQTNKIISGELVPHLHTLAEVSPLHTAEVFLKYLDQEYQSYQNCKKSKKRNCFPGIECMLILKYSSVLYSVSDYQHPVVTPAIIFMCDILSSSFLVTLSNITSRIFVCSVILDCVSQSKRFVPDVICFLNNTLRLALPVHTKITSKDTKLKEVNLVLLKKCKKIADLDLFNTDKSPLDDSKKMSIIFKSISLLHRFATLYTDLQSYKEIFSETVSICSKLPTNCYTDSLKDSINNLFEEINGKNTKLCHLVYPNTKPKPLKMFEPSFESKFDKRDNISKKFKLLKRVSQKIKKEERGVLRDMRRDAQMIASEKLKERLESDAERKRKVKELYHDLATQEGEYKKMIKKQP